MTSAETESQGPAQFSVQTLRKYLVSVLILDGKEILEAASEKRQEAIWRHWAELGSGRQINLQSNFFLVHSAVCGIDLEKQDVEKEEEHSLTSFHKFTQTTLVLGLLMERHQFLGTRRPGLNPKQNIYQLHGFSDLISDSVSIWKTEVVIPAMQSCLKIRNNAYDNDLGT